MVRPLHILPHMKTAFALLGMLMAATVAVGCAAPSADEEESVAGDQAALEQAWSLSTPTVFAIEGPIDTSFDDWSDLEVQDPLDPNHGWRPASTVSRPAVTETPSGGSSVVRQLQHGLGSGPCRPRLNPFKREIGFMCKWTF